MDIQGRPRMSRELLTRLSNHGSHADDGRLGSAQATNNTSLHTRTNVYRSSHLGNQYGVRQMGAEVGSRPSRRPNPRPGDTGTVKGVDSGQNRPSSGFTFQEPASRKYDPYG